MALDLSALDNFDEKALVAGVTENAPTAPLNEFVEDPANPRFEFDGPEFDKLVASIRARGILQPLIVRRDPVTGKLKIRFGARRYRAANMVGLTEIPYLITEDIRQFDDYSQVSENLDRKDLTPLEMARFIERKLADGEKKNKIAEKLKIDPSALTHLLALIEPPAFIQELYDSQRCRAPHYLYALRKLHEQNIDLVEKRCAAADEITISFITALSAEVNPPSSVAPEPSVKDVLGVRGGAASADGERLGSVVSQVIPPHNPDIEKETSKPKDPNRIKKPLLLGVYSGRNIMVVLTQRPSAAGLVIVRYEDGSGEEEVSIMEVTLTLLSESVG